MMVSQDVTGAFRTSTHVSANGKNGEDDLGFSAQHGFNLLSEQSLLNAFSLTEKLSLARDVDLFNRKSTVEQATPNALNANVMLDQSPFNDTYLLDKWCQHHHLEPQQLITLHNSQWLKQTVPFLTVSQAETNNETVPLQVQLQSPLLAAITLERDQLNLSLFTDQINTALLNACEQLKALKQLRQEQHKTAAAFDTDSLVLAFVPQLLQRLHQIADKAVDYTVRRYAGVEQSQAALRYRVYNHFPAMLRQVNLAALFWLDYLVEFAQHLANDFQSLAKVFFNDKPLGRFESLQNEQGDVHNKGRYALVCRFDCGRQLVYKPRSLALDHEFYQLLGFLDSNTHMDAFYQPTFLLRDDYGWMEYIENQPCDNQQQVTDYFFSSGRLLSVLYLLEAEDIHYNNVIAGKNGPVVIDLETLFHLRDDNIIGQQVQHVDHSVLKTHFIPQYERATPQQDEAAIMALSDSDMGKAEFKRTSLPTLAGVSQPVNDYHRQFSQGFAAGYAQLRTLKVPLLARLQRFKGLTARYIARPTRIYHGLWLSSCQPFYQQSAMQLELCYEKLWLDIRQRPILTDVVSAEKEALLQGDIPLFTQVIGEKAVYFGDDCLSAHYFKQDSFTLVTDKLNALSVAGGEAQLSIIERSLMLAQSQKPSLIKSQLSLKKMASSANWPAVSASVGQLLVAQAAVSEQSVFWPVYQRDHDGLFCLDATNTKLSDGTLGIVLYLAYLDKVMPQSIDGQLLKRSAREILMPLYQKSFAEAGCGGFEGLGGVVYVISHLLHLWQEDWLQTLAQTLITRLAGMVKQDSNYDVMSGSAGAILSLLSYDHICHDVQALDAAIAFGDHLAANFDQHCGGWPVSKDKANQKALTGFAHGNAGIAYALMRLNEVVPKLSYKTVADKAMAFERGTFCKQSGNWLDLRFDTMDEQEKQAMTAWCHGSMGIGYSRFELLQITDTVYKSDHLGNGPLLPEIEQAKADVLAKSQLNNHGLCHGHFGNLEFIQQLMAAGLCDELTQRDFNTQVNGYLASINHHGLSRYADQFEQLGLLEGLAGLGYQLLKLSLPQRLPSLLMLQPPVK